jgi:hypothetical protein
MRKMQTRVLLKLVLISSGVYSCKESYETLEAKDRSYTHKHNFYEEIYAGLGELPSIPLGDINYCFSSSLVTGNESFNFAIHGVYSRDNEEGTAVINYYYLPIEIPATNENDPFDLGAIYTSSNKKHNINKKKPTDNSESLVKFKRLENKCIYSLEINKEVLTEHSRPGDVGGMS